MRCVDLFLEAHPSPPGEIVLDLDATDDPLHGNQEDRFFHGYYKRYCYLPLYITCGDFVLCARLRPATSMPLAGRAAADRGADPRRLAGDADARRYRPHDLVRGGRARLRLRSPATPAWSSGWRRPCTSRRRCAVREGVAAFREWVPDPRLLERKRRVVGKASGCRGCAAQPALPSPTAARSARSRCTNRRTAGAGIWKTGSRSSSCGSCRSHQLARCAPPAPASPSPPSPVLMTLPPGRTAGHRVAGASADTIRTRSSRFTVSRRRICIAHVGLPAAAVR